MTSGLLRTPSDGSFTVDGATATQLDPASLSAGSHTARYTVTTSGCAGTASGSAVVTVNVQDVRCGNKNQNVTICYYGVTQCVSGKVAERYLKLGAKLGGCGAARLSYETETVVQLPLSLKAYPNPVIDALTVEVLAPSAGEGTFEIIDMPGRARQSRRQMLSEGRNEVVFWLGSLPTGIYLMRVRDAQNRQGVVRLKKE